MSEILNLIKDLRDRTGAGFVDCKKALVESNNDINNAITLLRKKGISRAVKKSKRETNEGVVSINIEKNSATIIEVNSETDFVAKNSDFLKFISTINQFSNTASSKEDIYNLIDDDGILIKDLLNNLISKVGENIVINKFAKINCDENSKIFGYVHNKYQENIGKIACLLKIQSELFDEELNNLAKNLCMHISATKPISIDIASLDKNVINNEKSILLDNIKSSGKPKNIINKIIDGKINKFYEEVVLLEQKFIIDNETKIKDLLTNYCKNNNIKVNIIDFKLFVLGN